jgi:hypothetical protein
MKYSYIPVHKIALNYAFYQLVSVMILSGT